ncbi:MAG TPA: ABC transporter permease subunit [Candidatus Acidoferrales bacterium]|jgi:NitT/TauT family transport system permease protein|nr:ABC transporter permease subunit [Candidatus Acidoferrales bacterium]
MKRPPAHRDPAKALAWGIFPPSIPSLLRDLPIFLAAFSVFYAFLAMARHWFAPASSQTEIDLRPGALLEYAMFSVMRIAIAYVISLVFSVAYGYVAAYSAKAERVMIPLLDTLQSIPVLSFLPGVMLAMVALFPSRQFGIELGSILLIFSGQAWNMAFSFYSSLKSIPREMHEAAEVYRWSPWQKLVQMELPFAAIGLVWNSMISVASAWFYLIACEMFVLKNRDFRLPGLGSYLQTAANAADTRAIVWGLVVMIGVIVAMDQLIWRPIIAWAEKFKFEQVEGTRAQRSPVLDLLRSSRLVPRMGRMFMAPARERIDLHFARGRIRRPENGNPSRSARWLSYAIGIAVLIGIAYGAVKMAGLAAMVTRSELYSIFVGGGATFLRVELTLVLAALWTIPAGVAIGMNAKLSAALQPIVQVVASVPATALFPIIILLLTRMGGGLAVGSIVLMLLGTQWYILFNVIAGAIALPTDLKEVCSVFRFGRWERWQQLFLPGIFPYLITGFVTASGGAWNASILAEYFHLNGQTFSTTGLGAVVSDAADKGNYPVLLVATMLMALIVLTINRLVWRRLYTLASTKFRLET